MSSSNQRPANRGFRSVLRCAISHYRQSPSLSAPEPFFSVQTVQVTPCAGAWIETLFFANFTLKKGRPLCGGVARRKGTPLEDDQHRSRKWEYRGRGGIESIDSLKSRLNDTVSVPYEGVY